jgi:HK97 gp10 family phage protein
MEVQFTITGLKETLAVFEELRQQIGDKESRSQILIPAVKEAMKPVLAVAQMLVHQDTGMLEHSLRISAKRATNKDRKSRYVTRGDTVVAFVETRTIPPKLKKRFNKEFYASAKNKTSSYRKEAKKFYEQNNVFYDGRAVANEFGTAHRAATPFLRPALESQAQQVTMLLNTILMSKIEQYKAKNV